MTERKLEKSSTVPGAVEASRRAKAEEISHQARAMLASEKQARDAKTARLRELREANEAAKRNG